METIGTITDLVAVFKISMIDLVLAGDNALVVGLVAAQVEPRLRSVVIFWGIVGAVVSRIILAVGVTYLLGIVGLTLVGGLLLLVVCWKLFREHARSRASPDAAMSNNLQGPTAGRAISMIVFADLSMSLDNVLAVAGAAQNNVNILIGGLVLAIIVMGIAARFIAGLLGRFPAIMWIGLSVIPLVALDMISRGTYEVSCRAMREVSCEMNIWEFLHSQLNFLAYPVKAP